MRHHRTSRLIVLAFFALLLIMAGYYVSVRRGVAAFDARVEAANKVLRDDMGMEWIELIRMRDGLFHDNYIWLRGGVATESQAERANAFIAEQFPGTYICCDGVPVDPWRWQDRSPGEASEAR